VTMGRKKNL